MKIFAQHLSTGKSNEEMKFEGKPLFVCKGGILRAYSFGKDIVIRTVLSQVGKLNRQQYFLRAKLHNVGIAEVNRSGTVTTEVAVMDENKPIKIEIFSSRPNKPEQLVCIFTTGVANPLATEVRIYNGINVEREITSRVRSDQSHKVTTEELRLETA